jgi:hypothetical protein
MPPSQQILDGLRAIANEWRSLAIAWHVVFGAGLTAFALGWRPGKRLAGMLLAIPLTSVSVLAWMTGNPFNGTFFAVVAAALAGLALKLPRGPITVAAPWMVITGGVLAAFGWAYPHFLDADSWTAHLYAAPLGLIPCPTLSALVGVALVVNGLGSRAWSLILSGSGVLYGVIGWFRLGVTIDGMLLVGAITLALAAVFDLGRASLESGSTNSAQARHFR